MGGYIGMDMNHGSVPHTVVGALLGLILLGSYVVGRAGSLAKFRSRRAPAGTFAAGLHGVRLRNGKVIAASRIRRLVYRNVQDSSVMLFAAGTGMTGGLAAAGAARHVADANAYAPISYQLELEADGRTIPIVGSLTMATAQALFEDVSRALNHR
ncbi:hypothetical protein DFR29_104111 [Tahibacter aquaticus]|uniref:Uncharacterized protein n=1 Tax=Tahibacter aquaticus TaxID=520092 RepID=A0A4R6Z284_9GAMM|nr:hypothetical protein [Tahibacter aquaticus]TDR45683.1 hypothetical protein DFR29_104111 [Tahibacter aquaticus]